MWSLADHSSVVSRASVSRLRSVSPAPTPRSTTWSHRLARRWQHVAGHSRAAPAADGQNRVRQQGRGHHPAAVPPGDHRAGADRPDAAGSSCAAGRPPPAGADVAGRRSPFPECAGRNQHRPRLGSPVLLEIPARSGRRPPSGRPAGLRRGRQPGQGRDRRHPVPQRPGFHDSRVQRRRDPAAERFARPHLRRQRRDLHRPRRRVLGAEHPARVHRRCTAGAGSVRRYPEAHGDAGRHSRRASDS